MFSYEEVRGKKADMVVVSTADGAGKVFWMGAIDVERYQGDLGDGRGQEDAFSAYCESVESDGY